MCLGGVLMLVLASLLISALLMTLYRSYISVKTKPSYYIKTYLTGQMMLILWSVFFLFERISPEAWMVTLFSYLKQGSLSLLGLFILIFVTKKYAIKPILKPMAFVMGIIPFLMLLLLALNEVFEVRDVPSHPMRVISAGLSLFIVMGSLLYFLRRNLKNKGLVSIRKFHFFIAVIIFPSYIQWINFLEVLDLSVDLLLVVMMFYMIFIVSLRMRYKLFNDIPFELEAVFENVHYGIVVISDTLEILSFNQAFFKQFIDINDLNYFPDLLERFKQLSNNKLSVDNILTSMNEVEQNQITGELKMELSSRSVDFTYTINSIYDSQENRYKKIATMVTFRDITQIKSLQYDIENKNFQLIEANNKLQEHMENLKELTVEKERDALMTEINDTFGHSMTEILALLEVCALLMEQEQEVRVEKAITDTIERARKALEEMRQSVSKYKKGVTIDD